jgi:hypothetical protein
MLALQTSDASIEIILCEPHDENAVRATPAEMAESAARRRT